jgi:hypothetical protein
MVVVYIVIAVLIVGVFAAFAITRYLSDHRTDGVIAKEMTTPPPPPKGIKPVDLSLVNAKTVVGTTVFQRGDSPGGGQGLPVDGIPCEQMEEAAIHIHVHLAIFNHGKQIAVPMLAGAAPVAGGTAQQPAICLYWLHTHDASGIIHIEAAQPDAPNGGLYTLGTFFDIWGYTLSPTQVANFKGPVTAYVNGQPFTGDPRSIEFTSHKNITLEVGTPLVNPPPTYTFPPGY